ncbi:MAG: TIGR01212 family radical SAM protein [Desulfotignum sp.]|nr:TIGR01212 family radical SAM protein [Desulfotignum sp.]
MDRSKRYTDYNSYLRGLFGERVQKIAVDAGLTCPNRDGSLSNEGCIYCNAKGSGTGAFGRGMGIREQIEAGKIPMMKKYKAKKFLAYFQSFTNTYTSVENMREMYDAAFSCEGVVGMAVGTRPDCVDEHKLDLIGSYAQKYLVWLEYGLQSVHDTTLAFINRGHTLKDFENAVANDPGKGYPDLRPCDPGAARRNPGHDAGHGPVSGRIRYSRSQDPPAVCDQRHAAGPAVSGGRLSAHDTAGICGNRV